MRRQTRRPTNDWPAWRYGPDNQSGVFISEVDVPYGWTEKPGQVFVPKIGPRVLDRQALEQKLRDKGITPHGNWSARYMEELVGK